MWFASPLEKDKKNNAFGRVKPFAIDTKKLELEMFKDGLISDYPTVDAFTLSDGSIWLSTPMFPVSKAVIHLVPQY